MKRFPHRVSLFPLNKTQTQANKLTYTNVIFIVFIILFIIHYLDTSVAHRLSFHSDGHLADMTRTITFFPTMGLRCIFLCYIRERVGVLTTRMACTFILLPAAGYRI